MGSAEVVSLLQSKDGRIDALLQQVEALTRRVISRNREVRSASVYQKWFELATDDQKFEPEKFNVHVPPMQTRDVHIEFYLPAELGPAKLKMGLWTAAPAEIPLNIAPPARSAPTLTAGGATLQSARRSSTPLSPTWSTGCISALAS
jgi:hypothetical protein